MQIILQKTKNPSRPLHSLHYNRRVAGQGMLEFALVLPVLLLLIIGIIEFARAFQAWLVISNAARFAVRIAVTGEYDFARYCDPSLSPIPADLNGSGKACRDEDGTNWAGIPNPSDAEIRAQRIAEIDYARLHTIHDTAEGMLIGILQDSTATRGIPGYYKITVCSSHPDYTYLPWPDDYCQGPDGLEEEHPGNPDIPGANRVTVYITYEHPIILPILNTIMPSVRLHADRTGILENFRVTRALALPPNMNLPTITPPPSPTPTETLTPTASPVPNCVCQVGEPRFPGEGYVEFPVTNQDTTDWQVYSLNFDWSFAEQYQAIVFGTQTGELYVDRSQWDTRSYLDYDPFDPIQRLVYNSDDRDSPTAVEGFSPNDFSAGSTYYMRFALADLWEDWPDGVIGDDFGLQITASNGCTCARQAVPRPLPTPFPTPTPLPDCTGETSLGPMLSPGDGWFARDIGTSVLGTSLERPASLPDAEREVLICGSGDDIWGTQDGFRFVTRLDESGILEFKARLIGFEGVDPWSKVGVMIRSATSPSAAYGFMLTTTENGTRYQYRYRPGLSAIGDDSVYTWNFRTPLWLRVVKVGKLVTGYLSQDGETWQMAGSQILEGLNEDYYLGLAVTSRSDGQLARAVFDQVSYHVPESAGCEYRESGLGALIFEAEHFMNATSVTDADGTFFWSGVTFPMGYSGEGAMLAYPHDPRDKNYNNTTIGPRMDYDIRFETPGTYTVYVRGRVHDFHGDGTNNDDSLLVGLNGQLISAGGNGVTGFSRNLWRWENTYTSVLTLNIATPGVYTLNIWMRENGMVVDRVFLLNNAYLGINRPSTGRVGEMWDALSYSNPGWAPNCSDYQVPTPTLTPTRTPTVTRTPTPYCPPGACTPTPTRTPTRTPTPLPPSTATPSRTPTSPATSTLPPAPTATHTPPGLPTRTPSATSPVSPTPGVTPPPTPTPPLGG
jgi:hypothetical protein